MQDLRAHGADHSDRKPEHEDCAGAPSEESGADTHSAAEVGLLLDRARDPNFIGELRSHACKARCLRACVRCVRPSVSGPRRAAAAANVAHASPQVWQAWSSRMPPRLLFVGILLTSVAIVLLNVPSTAVLPHQNPGVPSTYAVRNEISLPTGPLPTPPPPPITRLPLQDTGAKWCDLHADRLFQQVGGDAVTSRHFFSEWHQDWALASIFRLTHGLGGGQRPRRSHPNLTYVDLAVNEPELGSNTFFFDACLGWSGVCIEPHPQYHHTIAQRRSCALEPVCVSDSDSTIDFVLDAFRPEQSHVIYGAAGNAAHRLRMRCVRLSAILARHGIKHIDYLSLDGANDLSFRPRLPPVPACEPHVCSMLCSGSVA